MSRERDANGCAAVTREGWAHCMALDGYHTDERGREWAHFENSWSKIPPAMVPYHTGPTGWGNPTGAGFWVRAEAADRALKEGDSYAYSGVTGFPARDLKKLDWFIRAAPVRPIPHVFDLADATAILRRGHAVRVPDYTLAP